MFRKQILDLCFYCRAWDIFKIIARETKTEDVHTHKSLRIIKVITYILLFLILLSCLVIQKISLITLTSELRPKNETDTVMVVFILAIIFSFKLSFLLKRLPRVMLPIDRYMYFVFDFLKCRFAILPFDLSQYI